MKDPIHSTLGRRHFLGLAAAATAGTLAAPVLAKTTNEEPTKLLPPKGLFSTEFGDYRISTLLDGIIPLQKGYFSGDEQAIDAVLAEIGLTEGVVPAPVSAFLFQSKDKNILVDAGMGAISAMGPGYGHMMSALLAAGVSPAQIDIVVLTHAHPDHIGGLLDAEGNAVFPNAELVVAREEVAFWNNPETMAKAPEEAQGIFQFAQNCFKAYGDQLSQVDAGKEIAKGITLQAAHGHTPGHSVLRVDAGKKELMMVADLFHSAELYTAIPDIAFGFDVDSKQAAATRIKLFDQLASDKTILCGSHVHFPGFGRVLKEGKTYRYIPVSL